MTAVSPSLPICTVRSQGPSRQDKQVRATDKENKIKLATIACRSLAPDEEEDSDALAEELTVQGAGVWAQG